MIRVNNETTAETVRGTIRCPPRESGFYKAVPFETAGGWDYCAESTTRELCEEVTIELSDGFVAEKRIVPGEETLLRSRDDNWRGPWRHTLHGKLVQAGDMNRAHRITRRDDHGSVWGVLDEWGVLFIVRDAVR